MATQPTAAPAAQPDMLMRFLGIAEQIMVIGPKLVADSQNGYAQIKAAPDLEARIGDFLSVGETLFGDVKNALALL